LPNMMQFPDLALGELERDVLDALWSDGPLNPKEVHSRVSLSRGNSINTVSSALKRLFEKGLLEREKVSHAYVYRAVVTRTELQRQLIGEITTQFGAEGGTGFLAAFVDLAQGHGEDTLRLLEQMVADRLDGADE
jgi:predicted transcriptional regulator